MGRSMAEATADAGASIGLLARDKAKLQEVQSELPTEAVVAPADVRNPDEVKQAVDTVSSSLGSIDVLINNAGTSLKSRKGVQKEVVDVTVQEWRSVMETNLSGPFFCIKYVVPGMIEQKYGNVINISSGLGRRPEPRWQPYLTSKWGLEGFTRSIALELEQYNIRVNGLDPGGGVTTWATEDESPSKKISPDIMDDTAVELAALDEGGPNGKSMSVGEWEQLLD